MGGRFPTARQHRSDRTPLSSAPISARRRKTCRPRARRARAMAAMLEISGVHTFYGHIEALRGIDMAVSEGEIVTLIGANGAGKSTLLMTICGTPPAREGSIRFEGEDITRLPTFQIMRKGIAQSPEGRRIFPRMTVMENLQMGAVIGDPQHFS